MAMLRSFGAFEGWGPAGFGVLLLVFALVAWTRYLQHKETLRMLESGPEAHDLIEFSRSMRLRRGLILGIALLALGAGLGAGLSAADEAGVVDPAAAAALLGLSVFLFALGCGTVLLHILWMRQARVAAPPRNNQPDQPEEPKA
jgi:hypothetical protein